MGRNARGHSTASVPAGRTRAGLQTDEPRGSARGDQDRQVRARRSRRWRRGQTIIIFALSVTVLLGMGGLAIDVMRLFDLYARAERAAEAGALAGVIYLPCFYNSNSVTVATGSCPAGGTSPDGKTAIGRAMQEVYRNGFGTGSGGTSCVGQDATQEVAVCQVSGKSTDLRVTITETAPVYLLSAVGVGSTTISASAQAEYLPPIQMGARSSYFGDQGECNNSGVISACNPTSGTGHLQNFLASVNGPAELKEQGDPFVYCEEGPSQLPPTDSGSYSVYNGYTTNHRQWSTSDPRTTGHCGLPGSQPGNPDQQPTGYDGPMTHGTVHPGAYNYFITIPPGASNESVWVYTPNDIPTSPSSSSTFDQFLGGYNTYGGLTYNGYYDDPSFYFNVTYTLYSAPVTYSRSQDTQVSSITFAPYDMINGDLSEHGCSTDGAHVYNLGDPNNSYYNPGSIDKSGAHCQAISTVLSNESCVSLWCPISPAAGLGPGTYRLAVEVTGIKSTVSGQPASTFGWGAKDYAVKICGNGTSNPVGCTVPTGTAVAAWNNMDVIFQSPTDTSFDLACIPSQYAGRTVVAEIFDPGDGSGNIDIRLVPPTGSGVTITYPTGVPLYTDTSGTTWIAANTGGSAVLNGLWVNTQVTLPATYSGTCNGTTSTGWWQVAYSTYNGAPHDKVAVQFSLVGSPVHLVPLG